MNGHGGINPAKSISDHKVQKHFIFVAGVFFLFYVDMLYLPPPIVVSIWIISSTLFYLSIFYLPPSPPSSHLHWCLCGWCHGDCFIYLGVHSLQEEAGVQTTGREGRRQPFPNAGQWWHWQPHNVDGVTSEDFHRHLVSFNFIDNFCFINNFKFFSSSL